MSDVAIWVGAIAACAGVLVSVGSLIVACLAFWKSSCAQSDANTVQERHVAIEEQREKDRLAASSQAELRPELRRVGNSYRLYLVNRGAAAARRIQVEMDGKPLAEHTAAIINDPMPESVGGHGEVGCLLGVFGSSLKVKIVWDDDYGRDRTYETILTP